MFDTIPTIETPTIKRIPNGVHNFLNLLSTVSAWSRTAIATYVHRSPFEAPLIEIIVSSYAFLL